MNNNIDWNDVENKIAIICYKFDNLSRWHEDLAQELRLHAYYVSDNYYDLYRKAIDFWRTIQVKQSPEVPYFDLETIQVDMNEKISMQSFDETVKLIRKELSRPGYNKWDNDMLEVANKLFDIILSDIDDRLEIKRTPDKSNLNHYVNNRLNLSWVSEETGIGYKRVVGAMKFIEDVVRGLAAMNKIEIPDYYFDGYWEK